MFNSLSRVKLAVKLPILTIASAALCAIGIGVGSYMMVSKSTLHLIEHEMDSITLASREGFQNYLKDIESNLTFTANTSMVGEALSAFSREWSAIENDPLSHLQAAYIDNNPHALGEKHKLDAAEDGTGYADVHAEYHPWFRNLMELGGYYDVFLFDPSGNLIYSVFKEADFATNLNTGQWKDSDLGSAFRAAMASDTPGSVHFFDFKPYAPSAGAPASFISTPVFDASGQKIGVLSYQMPVDRLNTLAAQTPGMGETGELLIVGEDMYSRTDSRFSEESDILNLKLESSAIEAALAGESGLDRISSYRGMTLEVVAEPMSFGNVKFAVVTLKGLSEITEPIVAIRNGMLMIGVIALVLVTLAGFMMARSIVLPIKGLVASMLSLADGNTDLELKGAERADEIGDMSRAVAVFRDNAVERAKLEEDQASQQQAREQRQAMIDGMIEEFDGSIQSILGSVAEQVSTMDGTARALNGVADNANGKVVAAAAASEEASTNVQTVAAASEELASSIGEISRQVSQTNGVVGKALKMTEDTNTQISGLADAAQKIGDVVALIQDIAEQTNLLALNATIEAARAGEMGKGFAVVASEVKTLANQTAKATEEISAQISGVQSSTNVAVDSVAGIAEVMREVDTYTNAIAAAVEEQGAATNEISSNIQQAAHGTDEVATNVSGVTSAANETAQSAQQVLMTSGELSTQADELRKTVDTFLKKVAAA